LRAGWCPAAFRGSLGGSLLLRRLCVAELLLVTVAGRDAEEEGAQEEE
jgi:hypothetical protein